MTVPVHLNWWRTGQPVHRQRTGAQFNHRTLFYDWTEHQFFVDELVDQFLTSSNELKLSQSYSPLPFLKTIDAHIDRYNRWNINISLRYYLLVFCVLRFSVTFTSTLLFVITTSLTTVDIHLPHSPALSYVEIIYIFFSIEFIPASDRERFSIDQYLRAANLFSWDSFFLVYNWNP